MQDTATDNAPFRDIYSVSRLNREARAALEGSFPLVWIEGEISNFARPSSGHWYFSLKDDSAQVRGAMFRNRNMALRFTPENGMQVLVRARISMYEARGEYQIIVEHMEPAGDGALQRAFEALKQKLHQQGLFNAEHKQALPSHIQRIGVITSPSGAAIRDILTTLKRRYPAAHDIIYPVAVQGNESADQVVNMLKLAQQRAECDVLIVARGGGSLEDLWSFNEERVARAIHACKIPVVTGIGHEIDVTIADLVADQRAATPTAAAELVSPNQFELQTTLQLLGTRLSEAMSRYLRQQQQRVTWLSQRCQHPGQRLRQLSQQVDDYQLRLHNVLRQALRHYQTQTHHLKERLAAQHPGQKIKLHQQRLQHSIKQLHQQMMHVLETKQYQLSTLSQGLDAYSPLSTLDRGYAIITTEQNDKVIRQTSEVTIGDRIQARLAKGRLICDVQQILNEKN